MPYARIDMLAAFAVSRPQLMSLEVTGVGHYFSIHVRILKINWIQNAFNREEEI